MPADVRADQVMRLVCAAAEIHAAISATGCLDYGADPAFRRAEAVFQAAYRNATEAERAAFDRTQE